MCAGGLDQHPPHLSRGVGVYVCPWGLLTTATTTPTRVMRKKGPNT